ncbi:unnamed protein product [Calypogeia fissa]
MALYRAQYLYESEAGFGEYDLVANNCEHFSLYCKMYCKTEYVADGKLLGQTDCRLFGSPENVPFWPWVVTSIELDLLPSLPEICYSSISR